VPADAMCLNIVVATLRRIPLRVVNLGVWMIHTGIIVLCGLAFANRLLDSAHDGRPAHLGFFLRGQDPVLWFGS